MDIDRYANIVSDIEKYANIAFLAAFGLWLVLIVYGTIVKNNWGINFHRVACPDCGVEMSRVRMPNSGKQAMWGGYTCPNCQCEMDKWGRRIAAENPAPPFASPSHPPHMDVRRKSRHDCDRD
jgi:predicted RNA-binding Zn-ribbon protein involved in translation (DUF1610 family)